MNVVLNINDPVVTIRSPQRGSQRSPHQNSPRSSQFTTNYRKSGAFGCSTVWHRRAFVFFPSQNSSLFSTKYVSLIIAGTKAITKCLSKQVSSFKFQVSISFEQQHFFNYYYNHVCNKKILIKIQSFRILGYSRQEPELFP